MYGLIANKNLHQASKSISRNNTEERATPSTVEFEPINHINRKTRNTAGDAGEGTPKHKILGLKIDVA